MANRDAGRTRVPQTLAIGDEVIGHQAFDSQERVDKDKN